MVDTKINVLLQRLSCLRRNVVSVAAFLRAGVKHRLHGKTKQRVVLFGDVNGNYHEKRIYGECHGTTFCDDIEKYHEMTRCVAYHGMKLEWC